MAIGGTGDDFERIRLGAGRLVPPDPDLVGGGVPAFVGRVTSPASKIAVGHFLMVQPICVLGAEAEGGVGDFSAVGSATVPAYLVGPGVPSTGDYLVCRFVDNRWAVERSGVAKPPAGGGGGTIPSCFCTSIPTTLRMTSANPAGNYGMFQSCTIQYGPTPAWASSLNLGPEIYLSTGSFFDPLLASSPFSYLLTCRYNQFALTRLYPVSPYGSPYRDAILYTWLVGGYGNTCSPFHLDNGLAFPGSDPTCSVTIDQP